MDSHLRTTPVHIVWPLINPPPHSAMDRLGLTTACIFGPRGRWGKEREQCHADKPGQRHLTGRTHPTAMGAGRE